MTSISLPGASGSCFVKRVFTCGACVAVANPKVKINTERMSSFMLCIASVLSLSVKNRLDEVKFRCFPVKRTLRRQECSPRRSGGERTVYLSCSTKRFPPSCCFASRRQRSNETDAGRPVQRKLLAAGPANHTGGSRNRHGGDWLPGRPQGE